MNPIESIEYRIKQLTNQRVAIDLEVEELEKAAKRLRPFYMESGGITDTVRNALRQTGTVRVTPTQIRDVVVKQGFDLSGYTNAMATIHQILRRLEAAEQVKVYPQGNEKVYEWIGGDSPNSLTQYYAEGGNSPPRKTLADRLAKNLMEHEDKR